TANANQVADKIKSGMEGTKDTIERARSRAGETAAAARKAMETAPEKAGQLLGDNAGVVAGVGIAIGAIIAAALPETEVESKLMGRAVDGMKETAADAAQSGLQAVKDTTLSAADAATRSVSE